jgi:hypothetical protein
MEDPESKVVSSDRGEGGSIDQRMDVWTVSIPIPVGAVDAAAERAMESLAYLEAQIEHQEGHPVITVKVQAPSRDEAVSYAMQRVLAHFEWPNQT